MKRMLILTQILGGGLLAFATLPASVSNAETIACVAEPDLKGGGHWYYRILDGRKCWYRGKPMMPRESLYWPKSAHAARRAQAAASDEEAAASVRESAASETDGRNAAVPARAAEPGSWPSPLANEISFESRWLGLHAKP